MAVMGLRLGKVDVRWVREMTDFVVKAWVDGVPVGMASGKTGGDVMGVDVVRTGDCRMLEEIRAWVWGWSRITLNCLRKVYSFMYYENSSWGVSIYDAGAHTVTQPSPEQER